MRFALAIGLLALSGCASWFDQDEVVQDQQAPVTKAPARIDHGQVQLWPAIPELGAVVNQVAISTPEIVRKAAEVVEKSADAAVDRGVKQTALFDVVRVAAWAMGLGFLAFLFGGFIPIPGVRAAGGWTVALGAAIATIAPWLNDILGDDNVRLAGYAAFSILAVAFSVGGAWWFLDKVRDETRRR